MLDIILQTDLFTSLAAIFAVCLSFVNAAHLSYIDRYYFNAKNGTSSVFKTTKINAWVLWIIVTSVAIVHLSWMFLHHDNLGYTKLDYLKVVSLLYVIVGYVSINYLKTTTKTLSILVGKADTFQSQNPTEKAVRIWHSYRLSRVPSTSRLHTTHGRQGVRRALPRRPDGAACRTDLNPRTLILREQ